MAEHTVKLRHLLVKHIAPKLHQEFTKRRAGYTPRPMIKFIRELFGIQLLTGVEIGVASGVNAESILKTLNIDKLFLIDPYIPYIRHNGSLQTGFVNTFPLAKERLSKFRHKIIFVRKTSMEALNDTPNNLDFVYINGNHSYSFVKDDIQHYYPKIKSGGVIGGHDFDTTCLSVIKAVTEFAHNQNLEFYAKISDWWIRKPLK